MQGWIERDLKSFHFTIYSDDNGNDQDISIEHDKYEISDKNYNRILKALGNRTIEDWYERAYEVAVEWKSMSYE